MPPLGGIFQLIANDGRQDAMLMGHFNYGHGGLSRVKCNHCGRKTKYFYDDESHCIQCRMLVVRLLLRAQREFKRAHTGAKIMIMNKYEIGDRALISAYDPEESLAIARELVQYMGFGYVGDVVHLRRRSVQLTAVSEPVAHRNKFGDCNAPYAYITTLHFNVATPSTPMEIDVIAPLRLRELALAAVMRQPTAGQGFQCLPDELAEPILKAQPELAIRFLY